MNRADLETKCANLTAENGELLEDRDRLRAELAELKKRVRDTLYFNIAHMGWGAVYRMPPDDCRCELCKLHRDCEPKEEAKPC